MIGFVLLSLWGCGGSGGTSGGSTGATSINVVFPGQQAALNPNDLPDVMTPRESVPRLALTALLTHLKGLYEVRAAYAQVVPADVSSLLLLITGPGIPAPIAANIDMATGRVTVNVSVGNDRVFEVRAFPAGSSTPYFIGRTMPNVSPSGTNVAVKSRQSLPAGGEQSRQPEQAGRFDRLPPDRRERSRWRRPHLQRQRFASGAEYRPGELPDQRYVPLYGGRNIHGHGDRFGWHSRQQHHLRLGRAQCQPHPGGEQPWEPE